MNIQVEMDIVFLRNLVVLPKMFKFWIRLGSPLKVLRVPLRLQREQTQVASTPIHSEFGFDDDASGSRGGGMEEGRKSEI